MPDKVLVFYGSYRATRVGIHMANFVTNELRACGALPELIDAREIGLPIIDRMYKEYPKVPLRRQWKTSPEKIRAADAFVFIIGEYNLGPATGPEESHRSFSGRMVLATRCSGQLLAESIVRRPRQLGLASYPVGDGHGCRLEHSGRRPDSPYTRRAR